LLFALCQEDRMLPANLGGWHPSSLILNGVR
jgi:hypothetical protein